MKNTGLEQFNLQQDAYYSGRDLLQERLQAREARITRIEQAKAEKQAKLAQKAEAAEAARAADLEAAEHSWAGVKPEEDDRSFSIRARDKMQFLKEAAENDWETEAPQEDQSGLPFSHYSKDLSARFASSASRTAGWALSTPFNIHAATQEAGITSEEAEAFQRVKHDRDLDSSIQRIKDKQALTGNASYGQTQLERLQATERQASDDDIALMDDTDRTKMGTAFERLSKGERSRDIANKITEHYDISHIVNRQDTDEHEAKIAELNADHIEALRSAGEAFEDGDVVDGLVEAVPALSKALANIGWESLKRPDMAAKYLADNSADLALSAQGKLAMGAVSLLYMSDTYRKGIERRMEQNGGVLPSEEERLETAQNAGMAAVAGYLGNAATIKVAMPTKLSPPDGLVGGAVRASSRISAASTADGLAEGAQEYFEGQAENDPRSLEDIQKAVTIGTALTGAAATPGAIATEVASKGKSERTQKKEKEDTAQTKATIDSGDSEGISDPRSINYNPDKALEVVRGILSKKTASKEQKAKAKENLTHIISDLETKQAETQEAYDGSLARNEDAIEKVLSTADAKRKEFADDPEKLERLERRIEIAQNQKEELDADDSSLKKKRAEARKLHEAAQSKLAEAEKVRDFVSKQDRPSPEELSETVAKANESPEIEGSQEAASEVLRMAMEDPESVSPQQAAELASNEANALNPEQREVLLRFSEARAEANSLKGMEGVSTDVFAGRKATKDSPAYVGIDQYRSRFNAQMEAGNTERAQAQLTSLENFAKQREAKAAGITDALNTIQESDGSIERIDIAPDADGLWGQTAKPFKNNKERMRAGGVVVRGTSGKLSEQVSQEARAVRAAAEELKAAYNYSNANNQAQETSQARTSESTEPAEATETVQQPKQETTPQQDNTSASVPVMITQADRAKLTELGHSNDSIRKMRPQEAKDIIDASVTQPQRERSTENVEKASQESSAEAPTTTTVAADVSSSKRAPSQMGANVERVSNPDRKTVQEGAKDNKVYAFDDNMRNYDAKGQSSIRKEPNTVGIPTRWETGYDQNSLFGINPEAEKAAITEAVDKLVQAEQEGKTVVLPEEGIGGGETKLRERSPEVADHLDSQLARLGHTEPSLDSVTEGTTTNEDLAPLEEGPDNSSSAVFDETTGTEVNPETGEVITSSSDTPKNDFSGEGKLKAVQAGEANNGAMQVNGPIDPDRFTTTNQITAYLTQEDRGEGKRASHGPMVHVADFISKLNNNFREASNFVSGEITEKQRALIQDMAPTVLKWNDNIAATLRDWNQKLVNSRHEDFIDYFRDEDNNGVIEENVHSAMSIALYEFMGSNVNERLHDKSAANKLLGHQGKRPMDDATFERVSQLGYHRNQIIDEIGGRAFEILGLSTMENAPKDVKAQFIGALGGRALMMAEAEGLVETEILNREQWVALSEADLGRIVEGAEFPFVRVSQDPNTLSHSEGSRISDVTKGTGSFLSKLFSVEDKKHFPTEKPVRAEIVFPKNSDQRAHPEQIKILNAENKKPQRINEDTYRITSMLNEDTRLAIAGGTVLSRQFTHPANVRSLEAKNEALLREYDNFNEFYGARTAEGIQADSPFYLERTLWRMGRMGIKGSMVNPQLSKIHRSLMRVEGQEQDVLIDGSDNNASLDSFYLAVADAMGIATDGQSNYQTLPKVEEKLKNPAISEAVDAVAYALSTGQSDDSFNASIESAVSEGGEGMQTFSALIALAQMKLAIDNGDSGFTHALTREIDGKTNGPILAHGLLGAANTVSDLLSVLERGGIFSFVDSTPAPTQEAIQTSKKMEEALTEGSVFRPAPEQSHVGVWAQQPGNLDIYQNVLRSMSDATASILAQKPKLVGFMQAFEFFSGGKDGQLMTAGKVTSAGRNLVKTPVTATQFSSGIGSVVEDMGKEFIESIHGKLEDMVNEPNPETKEQKRAAIASNLQTLFPGDKSISNMKADDLGKFHIRGKSAEALQKLYKRNAGEVIQQAIEANFESMIERRSPHTAAANASFFLHNAAYKHERNKYIQELIDSKKVYTEKETVWENGKPKKGTKDVPLQDLTPAQEADIALRVAAMKPVINTAFSAIEGGPEGGIGLHKGSFKHTGAKAYTNITKPNPKAVDANGNKLKRLYSRGKEFVREAPGVAGLIWQTHSTDGFVAAKSLVGQMVLNAHDALFASPDKAADVGRQLNHNTFEALTGFSPLQNMAVTYSKTLKGFSEYLETLDPAEAKQVREGVLDGLRTMDGEASDGQLMGMLKDMERDIHREAKRGDLIRLRTLRNVTYVNQYNVEGGHYEVTAEDRAKIDNLIKEIEGREAPQMFSNAVVDALNSASTGRKVEPQRDYSSQPNDVFDTAEQTQSEVDGEASHEDSSLENYPLLDMWKVDRKTKDLADNLIHTVNKPNAKGSDLISAVRQGAPKSIGLILDALGSNKNVQEASIDGANRLAGELGNTTISASGRKASINLRAAIEAVTRNKANFPNNSAMDTLRELATHELIHLGVAEVLSDNMPASKRLRERLKTVQQDIHNWKEANPETFNQLHDTTKRELEIMMGDIQEVPTYAMSAKRIQKVLRDVPSSNRATAWSKFVKAVREALGLNKAELSVLDEVISITDEAINIDGAEPNTAINGIKLRMENPGSTKTPMDYTTEEIFKALEDPTSPLTATEQGQLESLLNDIVGGLHGPAGAFKDRAREGEAVNPDDVFLKAKMSGKNPFVSDVQVAGLDLNNQQMFVLEQVEATIAASMNDSNSMFARKELNNIWKQAQEAIGPEAFHNGDWTQATDTEITEANRKRDFVFETATDSQKQGDYLARFAALAMVHPGMKAKMDFASASRKRGDTSTLSGWLKEVFLKVLGMFHNRMTKTFDGQKADEKVWSLMDTLVDIEARRRANENDKSLGFMDRMEDKASGVTSGFSEKAVNFYRSDFIRNRKSGVVRAASGLVAVVAADRGQAFLDHTERVRQEMAETKQGFVASTFSEMRGAHDKYIRKAHTILRSISKRNEQERIRQHDIAREMVLGSFENNGQDLTAEAKESLTKGLLDSNASSLLSKYTEGEILDLVESQSVRNTQRKGLETELKALVGNDADLFNGLAKDLAWKQMTGETAGEFVYNNTYNILRKAGLNESSVLSQAQIDAAVPVLDRLTSIHALQYMDANTRKSLIKTMRHELTRGDQSGVAAILGLHKVMQEKDQDTLFEGDRSLMQQGYRSQIYDPYKTVTVGNMSERGNLEAMGYKFISKLDNDPNDPSQDSKGLFVIPDGGNGRMVSGNISTVNEVMKGSSVGLKTKASQKQRDGFAKQRDAHIEMLRRQGANYDPRRKPKRGRPSPVFNRDGDVVDYRYEMTNFTKDKILRRNNKVEDVFGSMAAHSFDKPSSKEQSRTTIEALKAQYDADYLHNPKAYLKVSASSNDPQLAQAFKMLPDDTKQAVREIWGGQEMWVRNDLVDVTFGYRKLSVASPFLTEPADREGFKKMYANTIESMFELGYRLRGFTPEKSKQMRKRAYLRIRQGEDVWETLVTEIKDILVIKTGFTLLANTASNTSLLAMHGVGIKDIVKDHATGLEGAMSYKRDYYERGKLQLALDAGTVTDVAAAKRRIGQLTKELETNPVAFMFEEGLMPSIVEDVDMFEDPYSYKTALREKASKWTNKVWGPAREAGKQAYMTKDTGMYKALSQGTQLSDFVARYTLYNHLTTRKRNRMNHDDAIQRSSEMFVNYDIPSHALMQKLNDLGIVMFTKYYLRIQRMIMTLYREEPARALSMVTFNQLLPGVPTLTDSEILGRLGNPIRDGALAYPGALEKLLTVKGLMYPFSD